MARASAVRTTRWLDDRLGLAALGKKQLRKVFPDHWSFMLGEIALWSFVVILVSGVFLTFWYKPSMTEVEYMGSYAQLRGLHMSEAYASTLELSFDVRGGLLMHQIHHWSALLFIAAMMTHMLRVLFTGAYRKPRELNYIIGMLLLILGTLEGFVGYSLPDDLLSGTGLRIAEGFILAIPVVGTYVSFFVFGGEFPGDDFISRLYTVHVLLVPGLILALIAAHMLLLVYHKHTQFPGPGRTNQNVVGYPLLPVYMAKAGGFFFVVFGVTTLMGAVAQINPVWKFGPYNPAEITAGSQPDWYMGWLDGALRIVPGLETEAFGYTLSWNVLVPAILLPTVMIVLLLGWPFLEGWVTGDRREHHLLERPRNAPTRTGIVVALMTFYGVLWLAAATDLLAVEFSLSLNAIIWAARVMVFVGPVLAFTVTKRLCIALQRSDREKLLYGRETGVIMRLPNGQYVEKHAPLAKAEAWRISSHERREVLKTPAAEDTNGVPNPASRGDRVRARVSRFWYGDDVDKPTHAEVEEAHADSQGHRESRE